MKTLLWAGMVALLVTLLSGCGGLAPDVPGPATAAIAVIDAIDADTNEPITVDATAVVGGVRGTITPAEGSVVLRDVPFGSGTPPTQPLTVTAPGYVTFAEPIQISLTVVTFFTATLQPADPAETGTVQGTITDDQGKPIVSALVKFTQVGPASTTEIRGYTDKDGVYKIGGIPIGVNTVTAEAQGFVTATKQATVVQDQGGTNANVDLSLISGDTKLDVVGTVVNAFNERPLAGAQVKFGDVATVTTDANGEFTIVNVPVGPHVVIITLSGFDKIQQSVDVLPGMGRLRFGMTSTAPEPPGGPYNLQGRVTLNGAADNSGAT
ncbi:MAG: carboxypeptidase regulatory-like domain-containing protein, partial [Bacteroidota bacterium]